jgi:hypothetical protein
MALRGRGAESPAEVRAKRRRAESPAAPGSQLLSHPTEEQRSIIDAVHRGESFCVVANAGTGKTRTLLQAAMALQKRTLFLAYNRDIREEVQRLVEAYGLSHVDVENFDSLLLNYYDKKAASQDFQLCLQKVLDEGDAARPLKDIVWETVFVDEAQDMDENYLRFVQKVLKDNLLPGTVQVVAVGDPKQNIFKYRGADAKYFLKHDFCLAGAQALRLRLSESFRFNSEVCAFVDAVCRPLYGEDYFSHTSGVAGAPGGVEHWVLEGRIGATHDAFIARLQELRAELDANQGLQADERLLAFLAGSQKESNDALWGLVESVGCLDVALNPYALIVEEPTVAPQAGRPLAFVKNVHGCKGKTFEVAVLFVTTWRSWITPVGVERETLYVALTRARRLLVVERSDSLVMQDIYDKALPDWATKPACPRPRCSTSGAFLQLPLQKQVWDGGRSFSKSYLCERVTKISLRAKRDLLALIDALPLYDWQEELRDTAAETSSKNFLHALAAWLRLEHDRNQAKSKFNNFFASLLQKKPVEEVYATLWQSRRRRQLAPHLGSRLLALAGGAALTALDYLEAAKFHPAFQYGYVVLADTEAADVARSEGIYRALDLELRQSREPQKVFELRFERRNLCRGDALQPVAEFGVYITTDDAVLLLKAETVEVEGLHDRLLAAYVSAKLSCTRYEVVYAPLELGRPVLMAEGSVKAEDRIAYIDTFERAIEASSS